MQMVVPLRYVLSGLAFIGHAVSSSFGSNVLFLTDKEEDLYLKCNLHCPYGFETDIEGRHICRCHDPCLAIFCLQGTVCKVEFPVHCKWKSCKAKPYCAEVETRSNWPKCQLSQSRLLNIPQNDANENWFAENKRGSEDDCSLPITQEAFSCKKKRRHWYFNPMTGKCIRFIGCDTSGNNFKRKRYCKATCRRKIILSRRARIERRLCRKADKVKISR